ncbi:MAG: hypothetical protein AAF743_11615, partial [Planctomycetota bacterium]
MDGQSKRGWITFASATLVLVAVTASTLVLATVTRYGLGLSPDSRGYLLAAEQFAADRTIRVPDRAGELAPMTQFPPGLPVVLGLAIDAGFDAEHVARWINVGGLSVLAVFAVILARLGGARWPVAFVAGTIIAASAQLVSVHAMLWSEPLANVLLVGGLVLLVMHVRGRGGRVGPWLIVAAGLFAAATMVRYAAIAAVVGAIIALLTAAGSRHHRLASAAVMGVVGAGPFTLWAWRNHTLTGRASGRELAFHPPSAGDITSFAEAIGDWVLALRWVPNGLAAVVGVALVIAFVVVIRKGQDRSEPRPAALFRVVGWYVLAYFVFLLVSLTFVDAHTPVDSRILSPFRVVMPVVLVVGAAAALERSRDLSKRWLLAGLATLLVLQTAYIGTWAWAARAEYLGFRGDEFRLSPTLAFVRDELPPEALVYTNVPDVLFLLQGRSAKP